MQLAAGHNLSVTFVTDQLFRDVNFTIESGAHIGLVGSNGSGKSTLLRMLCGKLTPTAGQIVFAKDCRIAYMEQFLDAEESDTLYQTALRSFSSLIKMEERLRDISQLLTARHADGLIMEQSRLQEQYAELGGYTYRGRARSTLLGLGFGEADLDLPVRALSGGQRSKAALAQVLLADANLLLLDEPTNHLDIAGIQWLETYLAAYRGTSIVISHDRYFLDKIANETWDLHHGRLSCYPGNYSGHLAKRETEEESRRRRYQNQLKEIRRIEAVIAQQRRFNQARNYITIASKEKQIARLKAELAAPDNAERALSFSFNVPPPGGNDVLELHNVAKSFGQKRLFSQVDMQISKGERIFLLGPNGCGKSTLLKIILGLEQPDRGLVRLGANIFPTYYDQLHGHISGNESVLEHFTNAYPRLTQTKIRTMLGSFLFPGEEVNKTLDMLSGGEKARLELMKLILQPANFLLLDEPSNHLDIASMEAVEQALLAYPGTMLIVSHDRYLINKLADRIYYLTPEGLCETLGNYDDLLEQKAAVASRDTQTAADRGASTTAEQDYRRRKEEQAAERRRLRQIEQANAALLRAEQRLGAIEQEMNAPAHAVDYQLLMALNEEKEHLEVSYLELLEELEQLRS